MDHPGFGSRHNLGISDESAHPESQIATSKKFLFSAVTLVLFFLAVELLLAVVGFSASIFTETDEQHSWTELGYQQDPELPWSWIPSPGGKGIAGVAPFQFNNLGFRGKEPLSLEKPENTIRIVCMGDSCTMGWEVDDNQTFCHVLGKMLQRYLSVAVETVNAGIPGYTTFQGLHQLESRILKLKPDLILFSYCWNDHTFAIHMHETLDVLVQDKFLGLPDKDLPGSTISSKLHSSLSRLRSYRLMDSVIGKLNPKNEKDSQSASDSLNNVESVPVRVALDDYKRNLEKMIQITRKHGATPILMNQPFQALRSRDAFQELAKSLGYETSNENDWNNFCRNMKHLFLLRQKEYNVALQDVAENHQAEFLDMVSVFKKGNTEELLIDPVHPTPKGHTLIAKELSKAVLRVLKEEQ